MTPPNATTPKKLMRISASEFARRLNADLSTQDKGWYFGSNVARARQDEHPFAEWLPKLAAVIADESPLEVLAEWPEWQQADGGTTAGPDTK